MSYTPLQQRLWRERNQWRVRDYQRKQRAKPGRAEYVREYCRVWRKRKKRA